MIFHTILPVDDVFQGFEEEERILVEAEIGGAKLLVEPLGDGRGRVERVLSTDPAHYLDVRFQPGGVIPLLGE